MKFPIDLNLISEYSKAKSRHDKAKKALKKPEIAKVVKEGKDAGEVLKKVKKEIAARHPAITRAVKAIFTIAVNWKHVDTKYDYADVDVRLRDDAVVNATKLTDKEEKKLTDQVIKELKAA